MKGFAKWQVALAYFGMAAAVFSSVCWPYLNYNLMKVWPYLNSKIMEMWIWASS